MTTTGEERRTAVERAGPAAEAVGGPAVGAAGGWWHRWRAVVLDASLALASSVECAVEGVGFARDAGLPVAVGVVFGLLVGAVLGFRRRWPVAVVLVGLAVTPALMGFLLAVVGLYTVASSDLPRRLTGALAGMSLTGVLVVTLVRTSPEVDGWFQLFAAVTTALGHTAPPVLLGLYVGARRRLMESLRERADSLERELQLLAERAEERAEWARNEERRRIAREMHDVVAHRVSLMVVHAAALQAVALKDPEKAVRNAALVGDMGRQALTELREMLGVLRSTPAAGAAPVSASREAAVAPRIPEQRGGVGDEAETGGPARLSALGELVGQSRAAGVVVEFLEEGESPGYPPVVERTAFRVVQEALTNVHKHAAGARTRVRVAHREGEVAMQVENEPAGGGPAGAEPGLPSGGNGLLGMRERVTSLGGAFVAGPTDPGGFRVSAVIPVPPVADAAALAE
ncbi:histidine kinase [Streptomyces sp. NPDC002734]|uniref:sensor histidine kinase n=1 Tax=Streptomyces sp. NPDC002734 TaxID=3154426 RepID=UPI00332A8506